MTLHWLAVPPEAWSDLAPLLFAWNRRADGRVRCLHADQGRDLEAHAAELAALAPDDAAFWLCSDAGGPVGVIGCEIDRVAGRAWLRGPVAAAPEVLEAMGAQAMARLQAALPAIAQWDAFPAADEAPLERWYAAAGFEPLQLHRVLQAPAAALAAGAPAPQVRLATDADVAAAWALHLELFPTSYLSADDFGRGSQHRRLWAATDADGAVAGYLHAEDQPLLDEVYVDYLGVAPSERGRGLAAALLRQAAQWAVAQHRARLALTVREDRRSALGLYARCGFVEVSAGRHWQRRTA